MPMTPDQSAAIRASLAAGRTVAQAARETDSPREWVNRVADEMRNEGHTIARAPQGRKPKA